jgi:hypothetical protein
VQIASQFTLDTFARDTPGSIVEWLLSFAVQMQPSIDSLPGGP